MKIKKNYLKALIIFPILSLTAILPLSNYATNLTSQNLIEKQNDNLQSVATQAAAQQETTAPTLDLDSSKINGQYKASKFYAQNDMPTISNANGPVLLGDNGRSIAAYDWYGNPTWFLNLNSKDFNTLASQDQSSTTTKNYDAQASYYKYSNALSTQIDWSKVGKKIVDTAYLPSRDFLYVLTDTSYLFLIQSTTGTINSVKNVGNSINKISFIDFNNSLIGWNSNGSSGPVYKIDTQKLTTSTMMQNSASGINGKFIFDILPLDVGYNVALVSDTKINENLSSLTAILIQDDGNKFKNSQGNAEINGDKEKTITLSSFKASEVYSTTLKRNGSVILIVGNSIYNIVLNKSAMESTTFDELNTSGNGNTKIDFNKINSAFVDESNLIYLKDSSDKKAIYQISLDNKVSQNMAIATNGNGAVFGNTQAQNARIFPVLKTSDSQVSRKGVGYVASPDNFAATGFMNGSLLKENFTGGTKRPTFTLPTNFANSAPSSFDSNNIKVSIANSFDQYNTEFYADDISGELYVKTRLNVNSWYDTSYGATTSSYVIGKWNCAKIETVTKWVNQSNFNSIAGGLFAKRSPDQISDEDVTKYAEQILNLPSVVTSSDYKEIKIIVVERQGTVNGSNQGQIKLRATVKYKNRKGTIVSYLMQDETYKVKKEASEYKFQFYGGSEDGSNQNDIVDINSLGTAFTNFKNTLPSLIKPTSDNLQAFIQIEDKYPTDSRRVITITKADDTTGEITIKVHYNNLEATTNSTFSITYTGLATENSNKVNFKGDDILESEVPMYDGQNVFGEDKIKDITTISSYKDYDKKLATQIDASQLNLAYESNLSLMGFNPDVSIEKDDSNNGNISSKDAEYGSITLVLDYTNSESQLLGIKLPKDYWNKFGLHDGKITQRYIGFLPIGETYGVELKSYNSPEVQNIVQNNNVNADISSSDLISTLDVRGYNDEGTKADITVQNFTWNGENLTFSVHAQSTIYNTVTTDKTFTISWSPKFAAIRQRNLIISSTTSVAGVAIVSAAIAMYILRRNKIRRMMK